MHGRLQAASEVFDVRLKLLVLRLVPRVGEVLLRVNRIRDAGHLRNRRERCVNTIEYALKSEAQGALPFIETASHRRENDGTGDIASTKKENITVPFHQLNNPLQRIFVFG